MGLCINRGESGLLDDLWLRSVDRSDGRTGRCRREAVSWSLDEAVDGFGSVCMNRLISKSRKINRRMKDLDNQSNNVSISFR